MLVDSTKEIISGDVKRVYDILPQLSIMKDEEGALDFKIVYHGADSNVIPNLESKTKFWKDVYTKLTWDAESESYLDCNGCDIDVNSIVFANKNYALIASKYKNGDIYLEQQAICQTSKSSYIVNWVDIEAEKVNLEILVPLFDEDLLVQNNNHTGTLPDLEDMSEFIRSLNTGVSETEYTSVINLKSYPQDTTYHFEGNILVLDNSTLFARYAQVDPGYGQSSNLLDKIPDIKIGDVLMMRGITIHSSSSVVYFGDNLDIDANSVMFEYFLDKECTIEVDVVDLFKANFGY